MADKTAIEWCDSTYNPWWGCQKVSPACDHCYAERDAKRFAPGQVLWGVGSERRVFDENTPAGVKHWEQPRKWARLPFDECGSCRARGNLQQAVDFKRVCKKCGADSLKPARRRVFCASMADWLDLDAPLSEFVRLLDTIRVTPELDWLLLSKRIGNWRKRIDEAGEHAAVRGNTALSNWVTDWLRGDAPANVWLGATVVNQEEADRDIPKLLAVPARVRFLSIEPMLGAIDIRFAFADSGVIRCPRCMFGTNELHHGPCPNDGETLRSDPGVHWVIAGGESGPGARATHPDWPRSLRDQCKAAGVPFLFKQWGEWAPYDRSANDGAGLATPNALDEPMQKFGKKAAGRLLDGREHNGFPEVA